VPTVDKFATADEVFLPAHPYDLVSAGVFQHVPYIVGANSMEGLIHLHGTCSHEKIDLVFSAVLIATSYSSFAS
jgi:hypothetical protein